MAQGFLLNQRTRKNYIEATGGDSVTTYELNGVKYKVHKFENTGTFTVTDAGTDGIVELVMIGGGGAGGSAGGTPRNTGGGGGGRGGQTRSLGPAGLGGGPSSYGGGGGGEQSSGPGVVYIRYEYR